MKKVAIIGGGISGLIASILLSRNGVHCTLLERKDYPRHRVCGEYISNEAVPFLQTHDLYPTQFNPPVISQFQLSAVSGKSKVLPLDMGGFGISRFAFDHFLSVRAEASGVDLRTATTVSNVEFSGQSFQIKTDRGDLNADVVLGCFGKRSNLDSEMGRAFMKERSPYVGVKYHVEYDFPSGLIALHNFPGGYCGVSKVENDIVNLSYLVHRESVRRCGSISELEQKQLRINPFLDDIFRNSRFLFDKPEVINEISFKPKEPVEQRILMLGDAAGLITPLCGNGMAMAIHSAKIASDLVLRFTADPSYTRERMEHDYRTSWKKTFSRRLFAGRQLQRLFGSATASNAAVNLALYVRPVAMEMIRNTHGSAF